MTPSPLTLTSSITHVDRPLPAEMARFQFDNFRRRMRATGKTNESRAISRDLLRAIIYPLPVVTWLENYMPYRDRAAGGARCYGRYYKRPNDKINNRQSADAGVPILTPVRSSRLESRDGVTWVGVEGR